MGHRDGAAMSGLYCGWCGRPDHEGDHTACHTRRALEPPRYCASCARRMIVQVTPSGWTAECRTHGTVGPDRV